MRMAATCVLASILASGVTAHAETDVFMRTVGFALTGRDDADPKVIGDRAKCVFAINNDIFRLNNVHTDRITIQGWQRQQGLEQWVTVELYGDDVVFEETTEPLKDDGSRDNKAIKCGDARCIYLAPQHLQRTRIAFDHQQSGSCENGLAVHLQPRMYW